MQNAKFYIICKIMDSTYFTPYYIALQLKKYFADPFGSGRIVNPHQIKMLIQLKIRYIVLNPISSTYIQSTKLDMPYKVLLLCLLIFSLNADISIYQECVPCTAIPGCAECLVYSGGPFNNQNNSIIGQCMDSYPGGCSFFSYNKVEYSFRCGGCPVDGWCSYKTSIYQSDGILTQFGCSNNSDTTWKSIKQTLDNKYQKLYGNITHSWCDNVCDKVTPGQSSLIIIASIGIVSIALAIFSHFSRSKVQNIS